MSQTYPPDLLCVMTTAPAEVAATLAGGIVEHRLAACVQQIPLQSTYWWDGAVQSEPEILLLCKTSTARWEDLRDWILAQHPYEVPQISACPITAALPAWSQWLLDATTPARAEAAR